MFGLGVWEIGAILVVALIVLGPKKLPELARKLGEGLREFRSATESFKSTVNEEAYRPPQAPPASAPNAHAVNSEAAAQLAPGTTPQHLPPEEAAAVVEPASGAAPTPSAEPAGPADSAAAPAPPAEPADSAAASVPPAAPTPSAEPAPAASTGAAADEKQEAS